MVSRATERRNHKAVLASSAQRTQHSNANYQATIARLQNQIRLVDANFQIPHINSIPEFRGNQKTFESSDSMSP
jgi:hypothetical protein